MDENNLLQHTYPIGSLYLSTNDVSPASLFGGSWERVSQGRALYGAGEIEPNGLPPEQNSTTKIVYSAGQNKDAGIPNIMGRFSAKTYQDAQDSSGAINVFWYDTHVTPSGTNKDKNIWHVFSAANGECGTFNDKTAVSGEKFNVPINNYVYGKSMTVQPNAFIVNIWKRTA